MDWPFRSKGGMSSFLSFPKGNFTVFHRFILEDMPVIFLFERLSFNFCVDFIKADILLFLRLWKFSKLICAFSFLAGL